MYTHVETLRQVNSGNFCLIVANVVAKLLSCLDNPRSDELAPMRVLHRNAQRQAVMLAVHNADHQILPPDVVARFLIDDCFSCH